MGLLLIFAKFNLQFIDTGVLYYLTNFFGYVAIYLGLRNLKDEIEGIAQIQPFVLFMIIHSLGFIVLNGTGHSLRTISMSNGFSTSLSIGLAVLAVVGMLMVFYIIQQLFIAIRMEREAIDFHLNLITLTRFPDFLVILLILAGILFFIHPFSGNLAMMALLFAEMIFMVQLYAKTKIA